MISENIKKEIISLYVSGSSTKTISESFNISQKSVRYILSKNNIEIRNSSWNKGIKNSTGGGFKGHHATEKMKLIASKTHKGKTISEKQKELHRQLWLDPSINPITGKKGKDHPLYSKIPKSCGHYRRYPYLSPFQGLVYLKMSYELEYAIYLDENNISWYYEYKFFPININGRYTTYTPDFFLPETNKFIEVKGYLYPEAKLKIEKFKEIYNLNLEILYKNDLRKLGIKV